VTASNVNLTNATFELSGVQYNPLEDIVTANITGFESGGTVIENGLDVLKDVLANDLSIAYTSANYNTTEWDYETNNNALDVGYFIDDDIAVSTLIERICISLNGIFEVQDDGLFTFRIYDSDRVPVLEIEDDEWLGEPNIDIDATQYLSQVTVRYDRNVNQNYYRRVVYDDEEAAILAKFQVSKSRTIETGLTSEADATIKAQRIMEIAGDITPIVSWKTKTQNITLNIMDFIYASVNRITSEVVPRSKWEVIGIRKGTVDAEVQLTLRQVAEAPE
jgi:hypothetical protein